MKEVLLVVLGAFLAKITELLVDAVRKKRMEAATTTVVGLDEVLRWGWNGESLLARLIKLDQELIGNELTVEREGTVSQWAPVFTSHPESWRLLCKGPKNVVGYWCFASLNDVQFQRAKSGELLDSEIYEDTIAALDVPGSYNLYFVLLGVLPGVPGGGAKLIDAFFDQLESLANRGIFFKEVCANAYTKDGVRMCEGFGMPRVGAHKDFGMVYCLSLTPWPTKLRHKRWNGLVESYHHHFANLIDQAEHGH